MFVSGQAFLWNLCQVKPSYEIYISFWLIDYGNSLKLSSLNWNKRVEDDLYVNLFSDWMFAYRLHQFKILNLKFSGILQNFARTLRVLSWMLFDSVWFIVPDQIFNAFCECLQCNECLHFYNTLDSQNCNLFWTGDRIEKRQNFVANPINLCWEFVTAIHGIGKDYPINCITWLLLSLCDFWET